jgi:hypothetical protein
MLYLYHNLILNMITEQCISVTELKRDTKAVLASLKDWGPKVIFLNNKPIAVLTDIDDSNLSIKEDFEFNFGKEWIDPKVILDYFDKK